ncbi:Octopine transport system permease protein OccM [Pseudovibrio sp. Ad46]|uniref:ABC transporter permease n=1 Tax=unclassified Pseudovibrio TaxID=2627060 RepID=UPI0007AEDC8D|nr:MULTISPECIES: ABC transporter permease subunit [unclassified Pseudovibrio]KZK88581.1 Octopine transport system permease protein OccM [Pseudovibrio sp. Ad46]KZK91197.1 Octopine transport system permease protein OccM [Pseudovibrio sp. Ad5]
MPEQTLMKPHRLIMVLLAAVLVLTFAFMMDWAWLPKYSSEILDALWITIALLVSSIFAGFLLAVPIGLVQVTGPRPLAWLAMSFCTLIRGTPILLQMWVLYYGLGSLFPYLPGLRQSWLWPYLIEAWPYAFVALTLSFAGYEGEVMRGAFKGVPRGELEAAHAIGMHPFTILRRIWLPRAVQRVLPTLGGELILQLKATPLVATIAVVDVYAIFGRIRQETFIIYEPLLMLALIYLILAGGIAFAFRLLENKLPARG